MVLTVAVVQERRRTSPPWLALWGPHSACLSLKHKVYLCVCADSMKTERANKAQHFSSSLLKTSVRLEVKQTYQVWHIFWRIQRQANISVHCVMQQSRFPPSWSRSSALSQQMTPWGQNRLSLRLFTVPPGWVSFKPGCKTDASGPLCASFSSLVQERAVQMNSLSPP